MSDVDVLRTVIKAVGEMLPGVRVGERLPDEKDLIGAKPCVVIDLLPGDELSVSWGGSGMPAMRDLVSLDVEVFAPSRAAAVPVADRVRAALHQLPYLAGTGVTSVECPRLSTREDLNPRVRVLGVVCDLVLHADS